MFEGLKEWFRRAAGEDDVTVHKGDSLWAIAERGVGDGKRWRELADANPDKGFDDQHTVIKPGDKLRLPTSWEAW